MFFIFNGGLILQPYNGRKEQFICRYCSGHNIPGNKLLLHKNNFKKKKKKKKKFECVLL